MYDKIIKIYPQLQDKDFHPLTGTILLQDDGDGVVYIAKWENELPLPKNMTIGK